MYMLENFAQFEELERMGVFVFQRWFANASASLVIQPSAAGKLQNPDMLK